MNEPIADAKSLFPDRGSDVPIVKQLTDRLRTAIQNGGFEEGSRLLSSRALAERLGTSRNTVVAAIEQLVAEGYLVARVGSGTFVAEGVAQPSHRSDAVTRALPREAEHYLNLAAAARFRPGVLGAFRDGVPDLPSFPRATWERLERKTRRGSAWLSYAQTAGDASLRKALASHLRQFRGLTLDARDVLIVDGAQSAFTLIAGLMLEPGDAVIVEDPGYTAAHAAFAAGGARVLGVPIDDNGLAAADLPAARLAYVTPSHQFPLGGVMSAPRRMDLLHWARAHDAYVVEDDYDSEFCFLGNTLPAIHGADTDHRVIYVGTFSKVLAPGLRLGYIVAPPHLMPAFRAARAVTSLGASAFSQAVLAEFIAGGHLARHVRRQNVEYERRGRLLRDLLLEHLGPRVTVGPLTGGMHLTIRIDPGLDDVELARRASERGVFLHPLSIECVARTDLRGFILGFGMTPCDSMPEAVRVIAEIMPTDTA